MSNHIIPNTEIDLHQQSQDCICEPLLKIDEESGEMVWMHNILDWERLLVDFIEI
jgi:hypothetical protein